MRQNACATVSAASSVVSCFCNTFARSHWLASACATGDARERLLAPHWTQTRSINSKKRSGGLDCCALATQQRVWQHNPPQSGQTRAAADKYRCAGDARHLGKQFEICPRALKGCTAACFCARTRKVDETHNGRIIGNVGLSEVPMAWIPIVLPIKRR